MVQATQLGIFNINRKRAAINNIMQDFKNFYKQEVINESIKDFIRNPKALIATALFLGIVDQAYVIPSIKRISKEVQEKLNKMPPERAAQIQQKAIKTTNTPLVDKLLKQAIEASTIKRETPQQAMPIKDPQQMSQQILPMDKQKSQQFYKDALKYIKQNELGGTNINYRMPYKDHKGYETIGVGHLITSKEKKNKIFDNGISEQEVLDLFEKDIQSKLATARRLFKTYDEYPNYLKIKLLDGIFRGDVSGSPKTIALINAGKWTQAAAEFLDSKEYKDAVENGYGTGPRMKKIADAMLSMAEEQKSPDVPATNSPLLPETTPFF